ncbi:16S rRNA (cytosine(1402)-N(4))-methyltransferase [Kangiella profundi]|uniref:Ribosomal RNA small subunit methyltransferase H n=1 Tax=Kangiella profundi TaxID=1561924 RepID=A0A2K9A6B6_9GAMM|nr:16S rRNA (cytosine(1402)-N(4))-methyltransferase RsmH [Kangiella profundi]AUD78280.1 16S rRNA (cytosine(1402)-N(4))-methyltransferase [Kangiella profundi]GGF06752.1 ribosomal RNA small subunit methyltransferase H [Kangiella profundi]
MSTEQEHDSVLLNEAVEALVIDPNGIYIDCTFGRGGHSRAILSHLSQEGRLVGFDKDLQAIAVGEQLQQEDHRFSIVHESFSLLEQEVSKRGWVGEVTGVLMDLGVSSPQLDQAERGFSFMQDGPLDMRMDTTRGQTAAQWVANTDEEDMVWTFKTYGEERYAKRIARAIVEKRAKTPITRTKELADIISEAHPRWEKHKHPATRCFQAIRIAVNRELDDLRDTLEQALNILKVGGRLVAISFHSLEDRIVKQFIQRQEKGQDFPPGLPITEDMINRRMKKVGKFTKAGESELERNVRARSAVMRVAEKLA